MRNGRFLLLFGILALIGASSGCGTVAQGISPLPDRYPLGDNARAARLCHPVEIPRELHKSTLADYRVEPGDGLLVLPSDLDSKVRLPADQTILADGTIDLGKYGQLQVAGKSLPEIEQMVKQAVAKVEKEDAGFIDVRLVNRQSKVFYVLGEVTSPGKFPLAGNETVLDGIMAAGGMTDRSSWRDVILVRPTNDGTGQVLKVDYGAVVRSGTAGTNYQLVPGDRIYVGSRNIIDLIFSFDRFK
jgi:protein involved in polysaccharide export with SLBB domain